MSNTSIISKIMLIFNILIILKKLKTLITLRNLTGKLTPEEWHRVLNSSGCQTSMSVFMFSCFHPCQFSCFIFFIHVSFYVFIHASFHVFVFSSTSVFMFSSMSVFMLSRFHWSIWILFSAQVELFCSEFLVFVPHALCSRAEVQDFFKRMDRDYDGRLSFGEFMGEETPLEKVSENLEIFKLFWQNGNPGVQEHG